MSTAFSGFPERKRSPRAALAGRGAPRALVVLLFAALAVLLSVRWLGGGETGPRDAVGPPRAASGGTSAALPDGAPPPEASTRREAPETPSARPGTSTDGEPRLVDAPPDADRFRGQGILRGALSLEVEAPFPERWTLVLAPSRVLVGAEHAEERRVALEHGEKSFQVAALPLGAYDVSVEAEGWTGVHVPVLLQRASPEVFVTLPLVVAASVEGDLFEASGAPADGVLVTLSALEERAPRSATSDARGHFVVAGVADGAWRLTLGPVNAPVVKAELLDVRAPGMFLPPRTLPPMGAARLRVVDGGGVPVEGVELRGSGNDGGTLEGLTDADGVYLARYLKPGRWRVRATHVDHGRVHAIFQVGTGVETEHTIELP